MSELKTENGGFITIARFPYAAELALVEAELRERGIEFRVLDEHTAQVAPHYAAAIVGIRLQVRTMDTQVALSALADLGVPIDMEHQGSVLLDWFGRRTGNIPLFRSIPIGGRFLIIAAMVTSALITLLYLVFRTSDPARLMSNTWCVDTARFKGADLALSTTDLHLVSDRCSETIAFMPGGFVRLPGISSSAVNAKWRIVGDLLWVEEADTLGTVYNGSYEYSWMGSQLTLKNEQVIILTHAWMFNF